MKLTEKQRRFAEEYLTDLNATQAAIRAGYSEKTAYRTGADNLRKPQIANAIQKAMDERSERTQITADNVLNELAHIAFDKMSNYVSFRTGKAVVGYEDDGKPIIDYTQIIDMKDSEDIDTRNVSEISMSPKDGFKFKLYDKQKALVDLGKHLRLFTDRVQVENITPTFVEDVPEDD